MKRRVLSFIIALTLCLNLCPMWAFAAGEGTDGSLCPHHPSHTDECGYVPGSPGAPCTFACQICPVEDLIDKLPDNVSENNGGQVQVQLSEIYALYDGLTADEQRQVDLSLCISLQNQLDGMGLAALSDDSGDNASPDDPYVLTENLSSSVPYEISSLLKFDTNGYTFTGTNTTAIQVNGTGKLYLKGTVISRNGAGVEVLSGGVLNITEPDTSITGTTYALNIASGAEVRLSTGKYAGRNAAIRTADGNLADLLEPGYAYFNGTGNLLLPADAAKTQTIVVGQCPEHSDKTYTHTFGTTTHTWSCPYCGAGKVEACTFTFDANGTGSCEFCGNTLTIVVDENDLSNLVYDGTLQPEEVTITVTLTDGSNTVLVKDTDYKVDIESIRNAGQATVTVTGITFHGAFVKTYTVAQDTPGIQWDTTAYTVNYDGSAVTAGELPNITITIKASEDLHPFLKYAYKKNGDADFTDGLPADAGTYQVKAYLEESQNYEAAETDPLLTLTINQINPIVTAPTATKPTYNRSPQELVTAGELSPVAVADGLEIQFSTSQTGPWSTTIPTGTNAGTYDVWYKLEIPTEVAGNYIAPNPNPAKITGVEIQRKAITPVVTLSQYSYLYDGGFKEPTVTVKDEDRVTVLPDTEYEVEYKDNRDVGTAEVVVTDKIPNGGNYDLTTVTVEFKITLKTQDTLSITNKPATFTYGDKFTLQTSGGSGNGDVTWEITSGKDTVATVDVNSGQVTITGHGSVTVKATKSGKDPATGVVNYEDATATWTFTADKKPVTATVTADDKDYDGNAAATVHAVVASGVLPGDEITITGLTGTFDNANAGADKTVTVDSTGATITGTNSEHYAVTYSAVTVKATIHKAVAKITTAPAPANLTYNGMAQELIATGAVVDPADVPVEYALSKDGPWSTDFPTGTNAGTYTVWYRIKETPNYTGLAPASVDVTIAKKPVSPTITLDQDTFVYDGTEKKPVVTLKESNDAAAATIPASEYTVAYSGNVNVGTATVTVTAKADGNYTFENAPVTASFTINKEQAKVITAPEAAGLPLTFNTFAQRLVTAGTASGGTMVYSTDGENGTYSEDIPTKTDAAEYTVHYKVQGDSNHSDSAVGSVKVTIAPKRVDNPTIELQNADGSALVSYTYDGTAKTPKVVVKDGSDIISAGEYNIVYSDNIDAGRGTVNITDKPDGNYTVTGSAAFVINKADIVFNPAPTAATLIYNGTAQELLVPGTTTGGTVLYALNSATSSYSDAIPTGVNAGTYNVYYKVTGDKNHNDLPVQAAIPVTIGRKPLTTPTIELTPNSFKYDGTVHLPAVTVKDGDTVLPAGEYAWTCDNNAPTQGGTYTITVTDKTGGNYDLTGAAPNNTETFTIGKAAQDELVVEGKPEQVCYGDSFQLTTSGGSGTGGLTWAAVGGNAAIAADGTVTVTGVGEVTISVVKAGDTNYEQTSAQWTFTAAPKPVTAAVTVSSKPYDGNTTASVVSAGITTINSDAVAIDPASITAAFDDPHAGTGKTVTLDTSKVQVTGDTSKYAISYPATVTADITQATTTITTDPAAITSLTYSGQPQALVTAGKTNVGFLVYSLDGTNFSSDIPTGTDAGTYKVYYKVDETDDYTGVAVNTTPISVTIDPKNITSTVKVELSQSSYLYDGTKKDPKVTVKDGDTVLREGRDYTVTWVGNKSQTLDDMLRIVDNYTATIKNVTTGNNYTFSVTAAVEIKPADQAALSITGQPEHVYYGDTITTLGTTGGTGEGTVMWSVTSNGNNATIEENSGKLTITGTGAVTVRAERSVPNYGVVGDNWNFTVEPKPVTAEVTVAAKTYDGTTAIADADITAQVKAADLVGGDTVSLTGLKGAYTDPNAGTGKTVTLDSTNANVGGADAAKYAVSYPATAKGDINPKNVTVTVTLSDHDLQGNATDGYYYEYDGTEKKPGVIVEYDTPAVAIPASNYTVVYASNKNVGDATVTVTAKAGGNYTFSPETVNFEIRSAAAVLVSSPQAKDLTYEKGTQQELVTVGAATGGTVVYKLISAPASETGFDPTAGYSTSIPTGTNAGTYMVEYKVEGDDNHNDTAPGQVSVTIKPKEITPAITLDTTSYVYDGAAKTPTVTVKDDGTTIDGPGTSKPEYSVSYRDNVNAGTATVVISDANGGNYIVNGSVTFEITKAAPAVTDPEGKTGLYYTGEVQELVNAGVTSEGTVLYSVNSGNYSAVIPTASAVGTYNISWKVQGDGNHSDTTPATLSVEIAKNSVTNPTITLSSNQFTYDGNQHRPTVTVYDNNSRLIPQHEYTVSFTGTNGNVGMVDVDTYTVKITTPATSNYVIADDGTVNNTRTFEIVPADQETISITGTQAQVRYGDTIQLGVTGGTGSGTVTWAVAAKDGSTTIATGISATGLLTVKDVNTPITVTVTRSRGGNYTDVSATWEFTAAKKPVTAVVTAADRNYIAGDMTATVTASVPGSELVSGDSITISGLTGTFDNPNVGADKKVTVNSSNPTVTGTNSEKYDITYPATATASILGVAATVDTAPEAVASLTYDASQAQELVTAGTATGGTMVYSLDGKEFTPNIPKGKDAGTYKVYFKAQGDQNHTDSAVDSVDVTITQQSVTPQIELSPPSGQYDGTVQQPAVTLRDTANNVIPDSEYKVTYVTDGGKNWKDQGTYTVQVENITGGNYVVDTATKDFTISTTAQAPLEITGKPGLVYYGDTFTLSATGGSGSAAVTWSSSDTSIADIDANGFVTIKGTGSATITAAKAGGGNYDMATAAYPLNALQKPVTAIVTADDKVYDGNDSATIHVIWNGLVGGDTIDTENLVGKFEDSNVGTNKTVTITGTPVSDTTSQKYDITIPATTTASITKADAAAPAVTANTLTYTGSAQALVTGGDANTRYSTSRAGIYSATVPTGTNAGTYTVWYKAQGDANHNESAPQAVEVTISPKTLTLTDANVRVELSDHDLKKDTTVTPNVYYYEYDGTEKTPSVVIEDGAAVIPSGEYTVTYSDNKNVSTDKEATVTITDNAGGNYTVSGSVTFEIRKATAQLTSSPQARSLTYTGQPQELVTVGTATGGHIEYKLTSVPAGEPALNGNFSTNIPTGTNAGTYTVDYKVVGDANHNDGPNGSVTVTIQPKTVISPQITVTGTYTYNGTEQKPAGTAVTVVDGTTTIDASEYTLSYRDNVNVGTATVIVTDSNGGNYTVNGTATFEIVKAAASVGTVPTGKTGLKYNGTAQELLDTLGTATGGTLVYSLTQNGEYSAAIPTGKDVGSYTVYYKVQGDGNHTDSEAQSVTASIVVNNVTTPTINVEPASVKYTGEKQEPTVTVKDDSGLLIDGSEYTVTYADTANSNNSDLIQVGTYTVTVTEVANGNYTFDTTDGKNTDTFTITPADQTALTITGTRERVYYGDTIPLGTTGGSSGGTVTWKVGSGEPASIDANGLLTITGVGSVTVTATSSKTGYTDQTATWNLYADKKPVTALVTAASKTYDGSATATVTATLQTSDFVDTDSFTITLTGCTFEDPNAGTDKKVNVVSTNPTFTVNTGGTDNHENYAIAYPATATASIFKADIEAADVTAPTAATGLTYTGLPLELIATAGSATGGTMEYSVDGESYSASLPTGTNAGNYDVWYRVKGDGNHNDMVGTKLGSQVTIAKQTVDTLTIEFNPSGASYDGQEHKPSVTVKDTNGRVIPDSEYTVSYGSTNWKDVGDHTATITGKADGNYSITGTPTQTFTILPAGQSPLSIVGQPGEVRYGDVFTLSTNGGSGTGAVTWETSDSTVAYVNSLTGRVEIRKSGGPVTITARKAAGGGYGETTATWIFSAEKRPATAIVTARNKPYDGDTTATLDISWKDGDLLGNDTIMLSLTGAFDDANVGENKIVRITRNGDLPDGGGKYAVTYNNTTTASITAQAATVSGVQSGPWTYSGSEISLLQGGAATNGTIVYSRNGVDFMETSPTETNAGRYTVYYKARGNTNYADSDVRTVEVTIQPKTVVSPTIELSSDSFEYDGTPKEPDVIRILDGSNVIPASEYTVSYRNNTAVGTATVTITDVSGGNYTVSGSTTFTIKAGAPALTAEPQPRENLTYTGKAQALVTAGSAVNGKVVYSLEYDGTYSTAIPRATDADDYEVWYKVVSTDGTTETDPCDEPVEVTISPKEVTPVIRLENRSSYSVPYNGSVQEPDVTVYVESKLYNGLYDVEYSNNTNVGTAEVTVQSAEGGNYQFLAFKTFEITKGKAEFSTAPTAWQNLKYNGTAQRLVVAGAAKNNSGTVLYSLDNTAYSPAIPTAINRGSYTVYAKVQGSGNYEESDVVIVPVEIGVNTVQTPTVTLSATSFPYTGGEQKPTVTVTDDDGNVIDASEYTVTYSDNVNVGTAKVSVKSKTTGNYSFAAEKTFTIVDASQTPLAITGKKDTVYYGDTLSLGATGGGSGTVTWSCSNSDVATIDQTTGVVIIKKSGSVTITATRGSSTDSWTFYAQPKPVTAVVTAANKVYDGNNTATLTVTISNGLVGSDTFTVTAQGHFADTGVGENKTVVIDGLNISADVSAKYDIAYNSTTTASITPKAASVSNTDKPTLAGSLTYNGGEQALLTNGGTADGGNLMYSLDGLSYSYTIPTGTDAKTYTVWYKVEAADDNHKDSAAVKLGDVTIAPNVDTPTVLCTPSTVQYDGTEKTPTVVVRDSAQRIIPESEYTVAFAPGTRIAVGKYKVTVTDKPGGNYEFTSPVTVADAFEIVSASQNPLSIVTDIPTDVHYGDTFRLSAMGGSGSGAIQWSIAESGVATVNANGVVTVTGTGGFTVKAYRAASDGYSQSNTDSVPFVASPKPVTPVVTASDKTYDGKTDAVLTASWKSGDLVNGDTITIKATGAFATADAGTGKRVNITGHTATGMNTDKYAITWPDSTTASIYKVDAGLDTAPAGTNLTYTGSAQALVTAGTTVDGIGKIEYSTSQNGTYSETIPTGTNAGKYTIWYKVADSVNYTGIAPAAIEVEIKKANPTISTQPTASGTEGQKLSEIRLEGGATDVSGKFAWKDDNIVPQVGTSQQTVIFTPDDTDNYNTVTIQITVTVQSASNGGSGGSTGETSDDTGSADMNNISSISNTQTQTTVQNGTASTVVSDTDGSKLVQEAVANQSRNVVIKPEISSDVTKSEVFIPSSTVNQLSSTTDAALTVSSPIADVTISNAALDTLGQAGGTVSVVAEKAGQSVVLTLAAGGKTVEQVAGGLTLAVPAKDAGPGAVAVLIHDDGTREIVRKSVVTDDVMSIPLSGSSTVEIVDNSKDFSDVSPESEAADAVAFASAHELFIGTSETTFSPDQALSRGMLVTALYRLAGSPELELTDEFQDVSGDAWYAEGIAWAVKNGIADGESNDQFGPNNSITREQFAVMLWRYAGSPETSSQVLDDFVDAEQVGINAQAALCWAVENGILCDAGNGKLDPDGIPTRAQAAQLLKNFMENV